MTVSMYYIIKIPHDHIKTWIPDAETKYIPKKRHSN